MSEPTPGPWQVRPVDDKHGEIVAVESLKAIAAMFGTGEESAANARLIAAAPNLLQGVKDALDVLETESSPSSARFMALTILRNVIAEATGPSA